MNDRHQRTSRPGADDALAALSVATQLAGTGRGVPSGNDRALESGQEFRSVAWQLLAQPCQIVDASGVTRSGLAIADYQGSAPQVSSEDAPALPVFGERPSRRTRMERWAGAYLVVCFIVGIVLAPPATRFAVFAGYLVAVQAVKKEGATTEKTPGQSIPQVGCIFDRYERVVAQRQGWPKVVDMIREWQLRNFAKSKRRVAGVPLEFVGV